MTYKMYRLKISSREYELIQVGLMHAAFQEDKRKFYSKLSLKLDNQVIRKYYPKLLKKGKVKK